MRTFYTMLAAVAMSMGVTTAAQIVTTTPEILQVGSQGVVLTYHADAPEGNNGLKGLSSSVDVYAHIGLITSKSANGSDWKYTLTDWPNTGNQQAVNLAANRLTYVGPNTYTLTIGDIRTYFGVTNTTEIIKQIAIVFRNADGSKTGKTKNGGDIFVDVQPDGFVMELSSDHPDRVIPGPTTIEFTVKASANADLSLSVNGTTFATKSNATELKASYSFTERGDYTVEGKAVSGGRTLTKTMEISYPKASTQQNYPGGVPRMGTVRNADGSVTFCLAAPGKSGVVLSGSWDNYQVLDKNLMYYQDYNGQRYFWITVTGLADNEWYPYYYVVDDNYKVADPYAHLILDCYSDDALRASVWRDRPRYPSALKGQNIMLGVYRGDMDNYTFSPFTIPNHDNLVVYEMLFRDFTGRNGENRGWGTVQDAITKIPYLKELGVNAVELMPIMEFNGNNSWGYNTNFYMAPDKAYGSPTDYKDFVEACHQAGIAVILDIVLNQSDGLHPWYQMYPIDTNPFYNKVAPHSWSVLNDWNQGHALVQQQWTDALKYWMTAYNVDGFRFDLVKGLGNNDSYSGGTEAYNQSRINNMKRLHGVIKSVKPNGIHINELLAGAQEEKVLGEDGQLQWANVNNASCQFTMGWDNGDNNLRRFMASYDGGRPWGSTVSYAESHDEQRMAFKQELYGNGAVKTDETVQYNRLAQLAVQMLMIPGPKMIWQFGELGNSQSGKSINSNGQETGDNDMSPKYVDWTWVDDPSRSYLMHAYAAVIDLRMANPELFGRDATFTPERLNYKFNYTRAIRVSYGTKEAIAFINPAVSGDAVSISTESTTLSPSNSRLIYASQGFTPTLQGSTGNVSLEVPANGFAVYATRNVSGAEEIDAELGNAATVYGAEGRIVVAGDYNTLTVSDIAGRLYPTLNVPAGLYIVTVDGQASKVVVR